MPDYEYGYGINLVSNLLEFSPKRVKQIYLDESKQGAKTKKVVKQAQIKGVALRFCPRKDFERLLFERNVEQDVVHQGVLVEFDPEQTRDEKWLLSQLSKLQSPFYLALDGVTDPHNLGACLRSANAAGVDAVIVPSDKSVGLTPAVRKVACGAAEMTPLVVVKNLARCIDNLRKENIWAMGAAGEATQSLYELDLCGGLLLVMGAEGPGLRRLTRERCDHLFKIPMQGAIESLNVSVAAGVCLFEAARQRN